MTEFQNLNHRLEEIRQRPWSNEIYEAVKECRLTWWEWCKPGASKDNEDIYLKNMVSAKKNLRQVQRHETAKVRTGKVEEIMNSQNDKNVFIS